MYIEAKNERTLSFIKGLILGMGIIVPGVSGGTILIVFGIYDILLEDILKFRIKPYIVMGIGAILGVFAGSYIFTYLFEHHSNPASSFILGCILMSVPFILKRSGGKPKNNISLLILGFIISYALSNMNGSVQESNISMWQIFIGGCIASATMIIPGISGSAILIVIGIYEQILGAINSFDITYISVFAGGALLGVLTVSKLMKLIFSRYKSQILYFFSGMILGSSKMLFPDRLDIMSIGAFSLGLWIVYNWGSYKYK